MAFKQRSPLPIIEGGTNTQSFLHAFGVAYYDGASLNNVDPGISGYVLTSGGISGAPSFQPSGGSGGVTWNTVVVSTVTMVPVNGYIMNDGATLITATLPAISPVGSVFIVQGKDAGLWTIAQQAGQTIHFGAVSTTTGTGGSISSTDQYDSISLVCITANTDFAAFSSIGNLAWV